MVETTTQNGERNGCRARTADNAEQTDFFFVKLQVNCDRCGEMTPLRWIELTTLMNDGDFQNGVLVPSVRDAASQLQYNDKITALEAWAEQSAAAQLSKALSAVLESDEGVPLMPLNRTTKEQGVQASPDHDEAAPPKASTRKQGVQASLQQEQSASDKIKDSVAPGVLSCLGDSVSSVSRSGGSSSSYRADAFRTPGVERMRERKIIKGVQKDDRVNSASNSRHVSDKSLVANSINLLQSQVVTSPAAQRL